MDNKKSREVLESLLKVLEEVDENTEIKIVDSHKLKEPLRDAICLYEKDSPIACTEKIIEINDYEIVSHKCTICGWHIELGDRYCKHCGQKLKVV